MAGLFSAALRKDGIEGLPLIRICSAVYPVYLYHAPQAVSNEKQNRLPLPGKRNAQTERMYMTAEKKSFQ